MSFQPFLYWLLPSLVLGVVAALAPRSGGSHEISLIYEWPKRGKNKKWRAVPCPKF